MRLKGLRVRQSSTILWWKPYNTGEMQNACGKCVNYPYVFPERKE